ncbi:MAG: hypothetical protein ACE5MH_04670, partial [Terriglobia bacterium]
MTTILPRMRILNAMGILRKSLDALLKESVEWRIQKYNELKLDLDTYQQDRTSDVPYDLRM